MSRYSGAPVAELMKPDPRPLPVWAADMFVNALLLAVLLRAIGISTLGGALELAALLWPASARPSAIGPSRSPGCRRRCG